MDGLESAAAEQGKGGVRAYLEKVISSLGNRIFLMHDIHREKPELLQSRWALSFLRGPITREQVSRLMAPFKTPAVVPLPLCAACGADLGPDVTDHCPHCGKYPWAVPQAHLEDKAVRETSPHAAASNADGGATASEPATDHMPPVLPGDVKQFHLPAVEAQPKDAQLEMFPWVLGAANVVYVLDKHAGTEHTEAVHLLAQPPAAGHPTAWESAATLRRPRAGRRFSADGCAMDRRPGVDGHRPQAQGAGKGVRRTPLRHA